MILRDISFQTPEENILFDEVLLDLAEKGQGEESLRFWESSKKFVVLGKTSSLAEDVNMENVIQDDIPVLRRFSGGGTVLQGPGCLNYSLILSKIDNPILNDLRKSYEFILNEMIQSLKPLSLPITFEPISDLALLNKKFSGNAQHRGRNFILHHGTILYGFHLNDIERYLKMPQSIPPYRKGRAHSDFVTNIDLKKEEIKDLVRHGFRVKSQLDEVSSHETDCLKQFLTTKNTFLDLNQ